MDENGGRPLAAVFASPGRYIQGAGAVGRIGGVREGLGSERPLILGDPIIEELMGDTLDAIPGATRVEFGGECSPEEIDRVAGAASEGGADALVGIGGGKTIDAAKAVAHPAGLPLVVVPTIASTDAPTSSEVLAEVVDFCLEVGLPVTLVDIGLEDVTREDLQKVAEAACIEGETMHNMPFEVHPPMLVDAMLAADAYGQQRRPLLAGEAALPKVAR